MKMPSLKQLQHLVTLYDYQHFGRAAEACFISQSTLSASIINLEEVLQAQLLERDHKTFLFTPLGEEIVRRSRLLLKQSEELCDYAVHQGQAMQGNFYMGIIPTIAPFIVNELLNQCAQRYPDLTLFVREDTTDNVLHLLAEGKLDIVVLALPYATADFHTKVLARDYFRLVAPKSWFEQGYETDLRNVPDQSIFLLEKEHCLTGHALQACQLRDSKKINPFHATSLHTLIHMVSHQPGLTFLPSLAINSGLLAATDLMSLPLNNNTAYREIGIAWRATSYKTQNYLKMAEILQGIVEEKLGKG